MTVIGCEAYELSIKSKIPEASIWILFSIQDRFVVRHGVKRSAVPMLLHFVA